MTLSSLIARAGRKSSSDRTDEEAHRSAFAAIENDIAAAEDESDGAEGDGDDAAVA